jgi:hypothetical protein
MIRLRDILKENLNKGSSFDYGEFLFGDLNAEVSDPARLKKFLKKWYTKDEVNTKDELEFLSDLRAYTSDNKIGNLPKFFKILAPLKSKFPGILDPSKTKNKKTNLVYRGVSILVTSISKYDPKITQEYTEYNNLVVLEFNKKFMSFSVDLGVAHEHATNHGDHEEQTIKLIKKGLIPAIICIPITDVNLLFNPDFISMFSEYDVEEELFYLNNTVSTPKILIPNEVIDTIRENIDIIPDKYKIEYKKILKNENILITKNSPEGRKKNYGIEAREKIQQYIKDGSQGNLNLSGNPITSLPDNLTVNGNLNLNGTLITSLPNNLTVNGGLYLSETPITKLPDNLTVSGDLYLTRTKITSLPNNLTVNRDLYLDGTLITKLPDNLKVAGSLNLDHTLVTSLPNNLTVGGYLYLERTPISKKYTEEQLKEMLPGVKGKIFV